MDHLIGLNAGGSSGPLPQIAVTPTEAAELNRVAQATEQQAGPAADQWLYQTYIVSEPGGQSVGAVSVNFRDSRSIQQWTNATGVQRIRSRYTGFRWDTSRDRAVYDAHATELGPLPGNGGFGGVTDDADPSTGASPLSPQAMPDTTAAILARFRLIERRNENGVRTEDGKPVPSQYSYDLFSVLSSLLADSTSASQRAAALRGLAYVPGIELLGTRRDARGRLGIAIRYVWRGGLVGQDNLLIVDPRTGALLEQSFTALRTLRGVTPSESLYEQVYSQQAIVASMTALPGGGTQPYHGPASTVVK